MGKISTLKYARMLKKMTQQELADKSGVPLRTIQAYEQDYKDIGNAKAVTVLRLARALGLDVADLVAIED